MSTRATYLFQGHDSTPSVCFYIHYDGYESGAAGYFAAMLEMGRTRGGWPGSFIRANDLAEFTSSHEAHGDTEYRYTLGMFKGMPHVSVQARNSGGKWETIFAGRLSDFVNEHDERVGDQRFVDVAGGQVLTLAALNAQILSKVQSMRSYVAEFGPGGNAFGMLSEAQRVAASVPPGVLAGDAAALLETAAKWLDAVAERCKAIQAMPVQEIEALGTKLGVQPERPVYGGCGWLASVYRIAGREAAAASEAKAD